MGHHVTIVGAGGNIGSHLVPHLARMGTVAHLTLIDRDTYEPHNVKGQNIGARSVGRRKAVVQARRARAINSALDVTCIVGDVDNVPLGLFRGDVILACLDTRRARQSVNRIAWRLGVPWIDAGVLADGLLARIDVYRPGADNPCLECSWDDRHYASLEEPYDCAGSEIRSDHPTAGPSSLGALAASLQALECQKQMAGDRDALSPGTQVVVEGTGYRSAVTRRRRNPACRLTGHQPWKIQHLAQEPQGLSLRDLFAQAPDHRHTDLALSLDGSLFVDELVCRDCGAVRRLLRLEHRLRPSDLHCRSCHARLFVDGFSLVAGVDAGTLTRYQRRRPLSAFGIRRGDVVTVESRDGERHFQIGASLPGDARIPVLDEEGA